MKEVINEIMGGVAHGTVVNPQTPYSQNTNTHSGGLWNPTRSSVGVNISNVAPQMYGWQIQITNELMQHDLFIATQTPGGGKTLPVSVFWLDNLLGLNTRLLQAIDNDAQLNNIINRLIAIIDHPETLPKILWLTPFRALNIQTINQEFTDSFIKIFMQIVNITQAYTYNIANVTNPNQSLANNDLFHIMTNLADGNARNRLISLMHTLNEKYNELSFPVALANQQVQQEITNNINQLTTELFEIYEYIFRRFIQTRLVGNKFENDNTAVDNTTNQPKPVVIAIYESAAESLINKYQPGSLRLVVFDEIQKAQPSETFNVSENDRAKKISNAIDDILSNKAVRRATGPDATRLVLLSGTENKTSADALIHFYNTAYDRNFPQSTQMIEAKNTAHIRIQPFDDLRNQHYVENLIKKILAYKEKGIVFLLFNKAKIRELAEKCALGSGRGLSQTTRTGVGTPDKRYYSQNDVSTMGGRLEAGNIRNQLLRQAVTSGLGFTYSLKKTDIGYYEEIEQDNMIVQELFRNGKIRVLLATDNVEAGMNINVKELYIPKFEKMGKEIPIASRGQILNRVGRQPIECTIYTPSEFIDDVDKALNATNSDFVVAPPIMGAKAKARYYKGLITHK